MTNYQQRNIVIQKINTQCSHTNRRDFLLRRILGQYILFGWAPWDSLIKRLIFGGNWWPIAFLNFDSTNKPILSFCNKNISHEDYPVEFEQQNNLFPELKIDDLVIKNMTVDQEIFFHRLFFFIKF